MVRQLLVIRHAKSSWDTSTLTDFDRPLNQRGHHDAPEMAARLLAKKIPIDLIISSPANRALTTASYFARAYHLTGKNFIQAPELYGADPSVFYEVIRSRGNGFPTIAVFSHNPGITHFVNEISPAPIANMPTCGILGIRTNCDWKDFSTEGNSFWFFDHPKLA